MEWRSEFLDEIPDEDFPAKKSQKKRPPEPISDLRRTHISSKRGYPLWGYGTGTVLGTLYGYLYDGTGTVLGTLYGYLYGYGVKLQHRTCNLNFV